MKLILGLMLTLTSVGAFATTGECNIQGYAQKSFSAQSIYRFLNQVEVTTLEGCQVKLEKTVQALEQCMMIPAGRVSHVQMVFNGLEQVKSIEYVNASCGEQF